MSNDEDKSLLNAVPAWGSYLYQNFLLPAISPNIASDWFTSNSPFASSTAPQVDYFNFNKAEPTVPAPVPAPAQAPDSLPFQDTKQWQTNATAGPSNYYQPYYANTIPTSLLMPGYLPQMPAVAPQRQSSTTISPSVDVIDNTITTSPSPLTAQATPHMSPKRSAKRRADSLDSEEHSDHEHEIAEGVERDGMIWGMKVEDYRALSARERKRVRNRISARTFRAKRKEHLSTLESDIGAKDLKIRLATEEASRLRMEVADLKRRLAKYETVF